MRCGNGIGRMALFDPQFPCLRGGHLARFWHADLLRKRTVPTYRRRCIEPQCRLCRLRPQRCNFNPPVRYSIRCPPPRKTQPVPSSKTSSSKRILVLDGAMGTMVHALKFSEADFRGPAVRRALEGLEELHRHAVDHAARGDRATFIANISKPAPTSSRPTRSAPPASRWPISASRSHVRELNLAAVPLARARRRRDEPSHARAAAVRGRLDRPDEQATFDRRQRQRSGLSRPRRSTRWSRRTTSRSTALVEGGVDILLRRDGLRHAGAEGLPVRDRQVLRPTSDVRLPVMASFTIFEGGRTLSAQTVEACWNSIAHADLLSVGHQLRAWARASCGRTSKSCRDIAPVYVSCYPNAGLAERLRRLRRNARA